MSLALIIFLIFVGFTLGLSFWLGRRAKSASGYFAAHGQVGWFVNGIAFAGDYLSAASFLGICGMIAFFGYDGFLYSIGFLAGWVVALFVIAEPIKRLGKYTFADALNARFQSRGITLAAGVSTLVVSVFYLIPQMVGAGTLIKPLLGLEHHWGVLIVGSVVILIVVTAGMVSTTWVQFIKGSMLVIFCAMLVVAILARGLHVTSVAHDGPATKPTTRSVTPPKSGFAVAVKGVDRETGPLGPIDYVHAVGDSTILQWKQDAKDKELWTGQLVSGDSLLLPGGSSTFKGLRSENFFDRLDFISLMLALFCGTASLPHILIRYYTVKDATAARKSTVVGIAAIGFFYVLTLYIGLGALVSGALDPTNSNMAAPLLAREYGDFPFAIITAIAFTTVLGTVSGLILAASGAVAHDLIEHVLGRKLRDDAKVGAAKWSALVVGIIAMALGIWFEKLNVSFLVGWAFNVAASANLPALIMLLFWRGTTRQGIIASILVGLTTSVAWCLLSAPAYKDLYKLDPANAIAPFTQPGLVTIPLSFAVLVVVSLLTRTGDTRGANQTV
jgi:cation/acetate symporter